MRIELDHPVDCSDGPCGTVGDAVIDPRLRTVTHVIVEPHHRHHLARLVPIADVDESSTGRSLRLRCTAAELRRYPEVAETTSLRIGEWPQVDGNWEIGAQTILSMPLYNGPEFSGTYRPIPYSDRMLVGFDRIPAGEVEVRGDSTVEAAAGDTVGHIEGVVVGPGGRITHLVLERGHLWGRRDITVPVDSIRRIRTDRVELGLSAAEVSALPSVRAHRHGA